MTKILLNFDVASLYPSEVKLFGYSSRNQKNKKAYTDLLEMRIKAKHNQLTDDFLKPMGLTNKDLKTGLKLPLNAYTGTLRAPFNALYDNLQGFSICITGQCLILQLIHDLQKIPTLEMVEANTDAVQFFIDDSHEKEALDVLDAWQKKTGLELEEDRVVKLVARDVNNYVEITNPSDNYYEVNYKGGLFTGKHIFTWDKEKRIFHYSFEDDLKSNSLTICAEAIIKYLLFAIPVEKTINDCNDLFRFQIINHMGHTYNKMIIEYPDGTFKELQHNNRIYAGLEKTQCKIYKVKDDGRKDSLASCPPNPLVDNDNRVSIEMINKLWYIKYTKQKINDFIGGKEVFMEEKLDKLKKDELIELIKKEREEKNTMETSDNNTSDITYTNGYKNLENKIQKFRKLIRERNFVFDKDLPTNLGGGEYYSIEQVYDAVQDIALEVGLDFSFETIDVMRFDIGVFKPANGAPQNIATVKCLATFTDIDTGLYKNYTTIAQGSDSIDKAVTGATSYAFRNWFNKNFTPKKINGEYVDFTGEETIALDKAEEEKTTIKTPVYVTPEKKEKIVSEITSTPQETHDSDDTDKLVDLIYEYRTLSGEENAGAKKIDAIANNSYTDLDILNWTLAFESAINDLKKGGK